MAHGCGRGGRVVLPLARAAAVSTGLRLPSAKRAARARVSAACCSSKRSLILLIGSMGTQLPALSYAVGRVFVSQLVTTGTMKTTYGAESSPSATLVKLGLGLGLGLGSGLGLGLGFA